jgi:hypothetical protein
VHILFQEDTSDKEVVLSRKVAPWAAIEEYYFKLKMCVPV